MYEVRAFIGVGVRVTSDDERVGEGEFSAIVFFLHGFQFLTSGGGDTYLHNLI